MTAQGQVPPYSFAVLDQGTWDTTQGPLLPCGLWSAFLLPLLATGAEFLCDTQF